ncbi:hypothetical protein BKA70DRAFT_1225885 [Coprinopsis sp. MPI-PUGE-AT-0042]|nr:hypothetical protein BKA70DRAFT_1225885 [Coprinopsis sp. MPI-PUGE-AT-0042]
MPKCETPSSSSGSSISTRMPRLMAMTRSGRVLRQSVKSRDEARRPSPTLEVPDRTITSAVPRGDASAVVEITAHTTGPAARNQAVLEEANAGADEVASLRLALACANRALERQKKSARKAKEGARESQQELEEAREEIEQLTERLDKAEHDVQQYRNWWFNEVQFTKLILNKVPNANADWDLVRTSQSHYLGRF